MSVLHRHFPPAAAIVAIATMLAAQAAAGPATAPILDPAADTWAFPKEIPPATRSTGEPGSPTNVCGWDFSANVRTHPAESGQHIWPDIAIRPDGAVAVAWMDDHQAGGYHIFYSISTDDGATWSMPEKVDTRSTGAYSKFVDLDFTPSGIPVVVWEDDRFGDSAYKVFLSKRDPGGGGTPWTPNVQVNTIGSPPGGSYYMNPSLAVLDGNRFFVAWTDWRQGPFHQVFARRTSDGGATWGPEVQVSDGLGYQPVAGDPCLVDDPTSSTPGQERLFCVTNDWRGDVPGGRYPNVYFYRSTNGGASWSIGVQVNDIEPYFQQTSSHALVRLGNGMLTAGWLNDVFAGSEFRSCVSIDQGATWSASLMINQAGSGSVGTYSSIAAWGDGVFAGYDVYQSDWNSYFRASSDGGLSWVEDACRMDDDASGAPSGNTVVAAASAVRIYGAWMDGRPGFGAWKIYSTRGDLAVAAVDPISPVPSSPRPILFGAPNPSRLGSSVWITISGAPSAASLQVCDGMGRALRTLPLAAGRTAVIWDGRDAKGREAAPGVYCLRLEPGAGDPGSAPATRIVRLR